MYRLCYSIAIHLSSLHNIMSGVVTLKVCLMYDHEPKHITERDIAQVQRAETYQSAPNWLM